MSSPDPLAPPPEKGDPAPIDLDDASPIDPTPVIPGYRVEKRISGGAMGQVYLATQDTLDRPVAIKVMSPSLSIDATFRQRFLKEGKIIAQLQHPHIVTIHDIGECLNQYYMVMEYVEGGTLRERIDNGLVPEEALKILRQLASALGHAHRQGFIHRDVKPANVLFRDHNNAVLSDFGIAKAREDTSHLTETGIAVGTIRYMSPEQAQGIPLDGRSDLYSLGLVFFEMLAGFRPDRTLEGYIEPLPPELSRYKPLVDKLLAADPRERFTIAEDLIEAIDNLGDSKNPINSQPIDQPHGPKNGLPHRRNLAVILLASVVVALVSLGYFFWNRTVDPTFAVQVSYLYRSPEQRDFRSLFDNGVLHSGDHYQIRFMPKQDGYAYIFQTDSSGSIYMLFPPTEGDSQTGNSNPIQADRTYILPATDQAFELDEQLGQEQIRFLAFRERYPTLENQYAALVEARQAQDQTRVAELQAQLAQSLQSAPANALSILNFRHNPRGSHEL